MGEVSCPQCGNPNLDVDAQNSLGHGAVRIHDGRVFVRTFRLDFIQRAKLYYHSRAGTSAVALVVFQALKNQYSPSFFWPSACDSFIAFAASKGTPSSPSKPGLTSIPPSRFLKITSPTCCSATPARFSFGTSSNPDTSLPNRKIFSAARVTRLE